MINKIIRYMWFYKLGEKDKVLRMIKASFQIMDNFYVLNIQFSALFVKNPYQVACVDRFKHKKDNCSINQKVKNYFISFLD